MNDPSVRPTARWSVWRRVIVLAIGAGLFLVAAFAYNGLNTSWRTPEFVATGVEAKRGPIRELRVMALNAEKAQFREGGEFTDAWKVAAELDAIAAVIEREDVDLVQLSEIVLECGPEPLDQVEYLARKGGFAFRAASENYSFGLPFFRIRSGNALLSRVPMKALEAMQLAGSTPFWNPTNNRRVLWCELELDGAPLLVGSVRNDSRDLANNLVQTRELLDYVGARPALLLGDFNAEPTDASMRLLVETGRFTGLFHGPPTFPSTRPKRRIDHVLAPASWTVIGQHVVAAGNSDHLAVVSTFRLP